MITRLALFLWNLFSIYQFHIIWCESLKKLTEVDNFFNVENQTSIDSLANTENLTTSNDILTCFVNLTSVDNVTCIYKNDSTHLNDFGIDLLDTLLNEFPVAFQEQIDVNTTQEKEYFHDEIRQNNLAEIYQDIDDNEANITSPENYPEEELTILEMVAKFSKYMEKSGKRRLKTLAYKVKNLVNPTLYLNHILKVPKYLAELEKYFSFILEKKNGCEIDQQFIILDLLESSIKIFGKASEEMCGVIVHESNITLSLNQIDIIEESIGLAVFNEKKEAFNYICQKTYVCRRFPAYSDYIAKLLKSILKLKDNHFKIIVNVIEDTIKDKTKFLRSIMDETAHNITQELESIADNPLKVSALMTVIIKIIMQRFKVFYTNGVEIRNSTKAVRIVIDIIDVTFQVFDENIVGTDFRDLTKCIIDWGRGKKRDMERILSDFLYDAVDLLDVYWNREIKEEVKVLIQFIIQGTSDNDTLCHHLFTNGSSIGTNEHTIYAESIT